MAEVTVVADSREDNVSGHLREVSAKVNIVTDNDVWTDHGLNTIRAASALDTASGDAIACTFSGGTLTFVNGGGVNGVSVTVSGW